MILKHSEISPPNGHCPFNKHCLLNGLDEIGLTLERAGDIRAFEARHRERQPWLFE